ncbi:ras protein [Roridomyces roridus]|uniref:Ras protein n=1 Tax=Roridomyces roridus TaxID=1738132 RepID=A0AAD7BXL7_9AGAR|nr:ras protein [Roridomyces roridus]
MDQWTVAMLGDSGVGKTTLVTQFILNSFLDTVPEVMMLQDDHRKQLIVDNRMCVVSVVHNADLDECAARRQEWLREGQGFVLVYSVSDRASFDRLSHWREIIKGDPAALLLVGNKCDKNYAREVTKAEGEARATELGCSFLETSAKTAQNVERLFTTMVRLLRDAEAGRVAAASEPAQRRSRKKTIARCSVL